MPSAPTHATAIVAARGGSKGIPRKNLVDLCGKPLIAWTIEQALACGRFEAVWVSSDDAEILDVARDRGARAILRPARLADDLASSESAWAHALDEIESADGPVDVVCALQATSPLREPADLQRGLDVFVAEGCDSLFSASVLEDFLIWERARDGTLRALNYDPANRGHRQDRVPQYVENGSFYLFTPSVLRETGSRIGGRVTMSKMEMWKAFEIDDEQGLAICATLLERFLVA